MSFQSFSKRHIGWCCASIIIIVKWFQRWGAAYKNERKPCDFLLNYGNNWGLKEEERFEENENLIEGWTEN